MKITILDMDTASIGGDVSLDALAELGEIKIFGKTGREDTSELISDSDAVICNKTRITREVMESCPNLKYVGLMGTGFDQVELSAAEEMRITVCNVPAYLCRGRLDREEIPFCFRPTHARACRQNHRADRMRRNRKEGSQNRRRLRYECACIQSSSPTVEGSTVCYLHPARAASA